MVNTGVGYPEGGLRGLHGGRNEGMVFSPSFIGYRIRAVRLLCLAKDVARHPHRVGAVDEYAPCEGMSFQLAAPRTFFEAAKDFFTP